MPSPLDLLARLLGRAPGARVHALCAREYSSAFSSDSGRFVLGDLARFCSGYESTHVPGDPYSSAVAEGRRQVLLRIMEYTETDPADLMRMAHRTQRLEAGAISEEREL